MDVSLFGSTGPPETVPPVRRASPADRKEQPLIKRRTKALAAMLGAAALAATACGGGSEPTSASGECQTPETPTITLAAYSTPREVYGKIIPAFQEKWKAEHNDQTVIFQESYGGSTSQAQNVINGFEADLAAEGVEVLTPDPVSSGGARWNLVAAYGAAMRGSAGNTEGDEAGAASLVEGLLGNVIAFDKTARDSIKNFEAGNADVAITYENEILTAQDAGLEDEMVIPPSTVLIENPVAMVDENVDKHCVREVAEAFVDFLHTPEAQELYTTVGFLRSTDPAKAQKGDPENGFPAIE